MADEETTFELQPTEHTSHYVSAGQAWLFVFLAVVVLLILAGGVAAILS